MDAPHDRVRIVQTTPSTVPEGAMRYEVESWYPHEGWQPCRPRKQRTWTEAVGKAARERRCRGLDPQPDV